MVDFVGLREYLGLAARQVAWLPGDQVPSGLPQEETVGEQCRTGGGLCGLITGATAVASSRCS